ncbi:ribosomal protein S18-alanine N-acetyltransferase [Alkalibacillus aidingensis]|uniref:ribosomal protein S18-alanine N-acetyltransferase n=1 Tax=Alkalibacillus aidingensis TaxID=2747607 RepID=UPI001660726E|nr:ribosomal protein S18-alanine N-acetyltransferase [Alkalibacillus aidingensis]
MSEIKVRPMVIGDIEDVMVVELTSFKSPWQKQDFIFDLLKNKFSYYLVLENNQKVVGYCGVWIVVDSAQITNIAIHPDERGHKYGEYLFKETLKLAKFEGAQELTLEVRESNQVAQKMYQKFGLEVVGRREKYYKDQEDALVMWVKL